MYEVIYRLDLCYTSLLHREPTIYLYTRTYTLGVGDKEENSKMKL